jgi:predicted dehydrogenase
VFDFRGSVDEDYMADPILPWPWRMTRDGAGLGTLGDLTCQLVSLAHELVGEIGSLCAMADVVHAKRPVAQEQGKVAVVENDDIAARSHTVSQWSPRRHECKPRSPRPQEWPEG